MGFLSAFGKAVPAPDDVKLYLRRDFPIDRELWYTGRIFRVQDSLYQNIDIFEQRSAMYAPAAAFIQRGKGLHQVHMDIERLSVTAAAARPAQVPVSLEHLEVSAIHRVGAVLLDKVENFFRILQAATVACCQGIFAE